MSPLIPSVFGNGQRGNMIVKKQGSLQQRQRRNCHICGDMANGFNLNVPRLIYSFLRKETFAQSGH